MHTLRYLPGREALKLRAEVGLLGLLRGEHSMCWARPEGGRRLPQVALQLAAAQRQRAKLDKQLWNLTKQGV